MEKIEQAKKEGGMMQVMKTCKPVNYVIITDGQPSTICVFISIYDR